jgi:V-type H+-transporting ATPase subunit d
VLPFPLLLSPTCFPRPSLIEIESTCTFQDYLEDFYRFCQGIGGPTADVMCKILAFEADRRAFNITINSFGTDLTKDDRLKVRCLDAA